MNRHVLRAAAAVLAAAASAVGSAAATAPPHVTVSVFATGLNNPSTG